MANRWEPKTIEINYCGAEKKEQRTRLEEVADILYLYFCQLERESTPAETTAAVPSITRRTGTDG